MSDEQQYFERDVMELDRNGSYYSRHLSAMTGEDLHDKSDIAAELAYRDAEIDRLQAAVNLRDSMMADKNNRYQTLRVAHNKTRRELEVAYSALKDIVSPLDRMVRITKAEGSVLSNQASTIANDTAYLRSIATEVLEGSPSSVLDVLRAQVKACEICDIIDAIGADVDAAHVVVMLRSRLAEVRNVEIPNAIKSQGLTSHIEDMLDTAVREERQATLKQLELLILMRTKNCKVRVTTKLLASILAELGDEKN